MVALVSNNWNLPCAKRIGCRLRLPGIAARLDHRVLDVQPLDCLHLEMRPAERIAHHVR